MQPVISTQSQVRAASAGAEFFALCRLGGPMAIVQLGMTAMGFVDVAMLGHYRSDALAGMALGHTLLWGVLMFCMGVLVGVDPLLSQAVGARDRDAVSYTLLRGGVLAALLAIPGVVLLVPAETVLSWLGQRPDLIAGAATYAHINTAGLLPFLWFQLLRTMLSAHSRVRLQLVVIVGANLLNAFLDWVFIFGRLGLPELGIAGAAWATVLSRWLMFLALLALSWREIGPHLRRVLDADVRAIVFAWAPLRRLLRIGMPIGAQFAMEMGVFALTALLIGWFGEHQLGGHQVALQLASLSFMLPLGLSMATAVRVGWAVGRGDADAARLSAKVALAAGAAVMTGFMLLFLLLPGPLARLLTDVDPVLAGAVALIPIAGVFQVGDGLQVTAIGCLRGIGDTKSPMLANLVGFWLLGLPLGCGLAFGAGLGPAGLWWGLCLGLFAVAIALLLVVKRGFGRDLQRLSARE